MRNFTKKSLMLAVIVCLLSIVGYGQVIISDGYEAGGSTWNKSLTPASYEVGDDIWAAVSGISTFSAEEGSLFWGMRDLNNPNGGNSAYHVLEYDAIDISGYTDVTLTFKYFTVGYDASDNINYEVRYDNGSTWSSGTALNKNTGAWTTITVDAPMGSSFVRLRLRADQDGGSDYAGFDDVVLSGTAIAVDPEPTNHPTDFLAGTGTPSNSVIDLVWTDAIGAQLPAGYVIEANTTGVFTDPVDGTDPTEDTDLSDGSALVKVGQGTEFYSFSGLSSSTQYFFKIWPYTNAGSAIDFKTDGTPEETDETTATDCGITALGTASTSCDTNTSGDDNDNVTITLSYTGVDVNAVLSITTNGTSETNNGDDPATDTDGTISFAASEGDTYSVMITGGSCSFSESGTVSSSECDPAPMFSIIINRVADPGDDSNNDSRFVEIKNVGNSTQDISGWELNRYANSNTSPAVNGIDAGAVLAPGDTYVVASTTFVTTYGCDPTETNNTTITGNGDDTYALFDDSDVLVDIYGEIGTDGTGEDWEYTNAIAVRNADVTVANAVWTSSEWTITGANSGDIDVCPVVPTPDNDECTNATVVSCGTTLTDETTIGATDNGDATGCSYGKGVWYSFEGTNQEITVTADGSDDTFDLGLSVSTSDNCTSFVNIDCVDGFTGAGFERITFFANSGTTYYFYVAYFGNTSNTVGTFDFSVSCADIGIASGTNDVCADVNDVTSSGSGAWLNIFDASGDIAASIFDSENLGVIETGVFINTGDVRQDGASTAYLDRNIGIEPATQPSGTVKVRLYLTSAEYDALAAADAGLNSVSDLNITKVNGGCTSMFSGSGTFAAQSASGTLDAGYFIEVEVTSFSNFFIQANLVGLPVEVTNFTAKAINSQAHLSFITETEESNAHFLIQRSTDEGKTFETIGQLDGQGDSNEATEYEFVDAKPAAGMNYYRLQQFDFDGTNELFGPVAVRFGTGTEETPNIWPVPTRERLQVEFPTSDAAWQLDVFDLNGKLLLSQTIEEKSLTTSLSVEHLPAGSYFLRWTNGQRSGQERFVKL